MWKEEGCERSCTTFGAEDQRGLSSYTLRNAALGEGVKRREKTLQDERFGVGGIIQGPHEVINRKCRPSVAKGLRELVHGRRRGQERNLV